MDETPEETLVSFAKMALASAGYSVKYPIKMRPGVETWDAYTAWGPGYRIGSFFNSREAAWAACADRWVENNTEKPDKDVLAVMMAPLANFAPGTNHGPLVKLTKPPIPDNFDDWDAAR
jgi:hypothetical protein